GGAWPWIYWSFDPLPIRINQDDCYTRQPQAWTTLGPDHPSDRCPLTPCQGRSQARLRMYVWAPLPSAVVLRPQTGLMANLQGFKIGHRRDGTSCKVARRDG